MGSAKPGSRQSAADISDDMVAAMAQHLTRSLLPGEGALSDEHLAQAATFVCDAAAQRAEGDIGLLIASESDGAENRRFTRIAIINDDMPFLVDSIGAAISDLGLVIDRLVHPVVPVRRDESGNLTDVLAHGSDNETARESMIYVETQRVDARERRKLEEAVTRVLGDVRVAVADWTKMRIGIGEDAQTLLDKEGADLLKWFGDGNLTLLGHVTHTRDGVQSEQLGVCRGSVTDLMSADSFARAFAWFDDGANRRHNVPLIVKANVISNVHRRVPLDLFIVPREKAGKVIALSVHAGVWTSAAMAQAPEKVPVLRSHLDALMAKFGFAASGHAGKALTHALTALPHDLMISFSADAIERVATTMMSLVDRPRPQIALVEAPLARHVFAFVWLPRDVSSSQLRTQIQALLENQTGGKTLDWTMAVEGGNLALLRFVLDRRGKDAPVDESAIALRFETMLRGWGEAVESVLARFEEPGRAAAIAMRFADQFPPAYRSEYGAEEAAFDILRLRLLGGGESDDHSAQSRRGVRLYRREDGPDNHLRLKVYQVGGALPLSDAVPALENFGFRVMEEIPTELDGEIAITIHDFCLALPEGVNTAPIFARTAQVEDALAAVLNGEAENDPFNRLVAAVAIDADEANWLRAFYRYLRQAGMGFTIYTVVEALCNAADATRALVALFRALHDPEFTGDRDDAAGTAREAIKQALTQVSAINDDRLLRLYHALIEAILRTNAFVPAGQEALAFKIESAQIPILPKPVPWREIFVYSTRVEGIHLRSGAVARGGLRWSDRRDDYRTEILGLMKAQRVKNAVIVPTGAKGGFYPKNLPNPALDRAGWAAEGQASYEVFIRALLSVTDNLANEAVVHPEGIVLRDGDDPYFVVAADKGTARFSDVANGIAQEHDFWLDDAFASGGSYGYDHKAMGITARGGWVSVQRHFLEMGTDVQTQSIDVVGCGDMSGDVFGNGLMLSQAVKLKAAFDHRHIFFDPDPDPSASWAERRRMFDLPTSSWDDYDKTLISKGGGVFPRSAKTIALTDEMRSVLMVEDLEMDPDALISAILRSPVDLIWFGGIGTYIKASHENNVQVGDHANDALRIDGKDIRAKVIGEGANLGVTQAGRIEFALSGGRINTDFIDNSAGVDCSDNEVNIKIALAAAMRSGALEREARNVLLTEMTDEVAHLVLEDNRLQALGLSIAEAGGAGATASYLRLIEAMEERGALDRKTEGLADNESLSRRANDGAGLTRPELAVLLSSAKLVLQDAIEHSDLPDDASLLPSLFAYFPTPMRTDFAEHITGHRLRREIIATKLANKVINRMGLVHVFELAEEEGVGLADVCAAFVVAEHLYGLPDLWRAVEEEAMPETARLMLFSYIASDIRSHMADILRSGMGRIAPSEMIGRLKPGVDQLGVRADVNLSGEIAQQSRRLKANLRDAGAPEALAERVVHVFDLDGSVGLASLALDLDLDAKALTAGFSDLGAQLGLDWAQVTASLLDPTDVWERLLVTGLARDFQQMRFEFIRRLAQNSRAGVGLEAAITAWISDHEAAIRQFRLVIARAKRQAPVTAASLAQIASQGRNLLNR